jgi:predicted amidophosphoribosyltransferase
MESLCRACGSELEIVELCEGCSKPVRWRCDNCLREKDSPHVHRALVQYVIAR